MEIAQMVKCSVKEQLGMIFRWTTPLVMIIGALVVYEYTEQKDTTNSSIHMFTQEIGSLRETLVELKTTIREIR